MLSAMAMVIVLAGVPAQEEVADLVYSQDFAGGIPAEWGPYDNYSKPGMTVVQDSPLGPGPALKISLDDKSTAGWYDKGACITFAEPLPWEPVDFISARVFVDQPVANARVFFHCDKGGWWDCTLDAPTPGKPGILRCSRSDFRLGWADNPSVPAPAEPGKILQLFFSVHNSAPVNSGAKVNVYLSDVRIGTMLLPLQQPLDCTRGTVAVWPIAKGDGDVSKAVAVRCGRAMVWATQDGDQVRFVGVAPEKAAVTLNGKELEAEWEQAGNGWRFRASAPKADLPPAAGVGAVKIDLSVGAGRWVGRGTVVRAMAAREALGLSLRTGAARLEPARVTMLAGKPVDMSLHVPEAWASAKVAATLITGSKVLVPMSETGRKNAVGETEIKLSTSAQSGWIMPGRHLASVEMTVGGEKVTATCPLDVKEMDRAGLRAAVALAKKNAEALGARAKARQGEKWWATAPLTTIPQIRDRERVDPAAWTKIKDPVTWADFDGTFQGGAQCGMGADDLALFFGHYDFGKIIKPHIGFFTRPGWQAMVKDVMQKGLSITSVWGYVPDSEWDTVLPKATHDELVSLMGRRFLGYEMGEQDGRYIGGYAPKYKPATRAEARKLFDDWHQKITDSFFGRMVALGSLNFSHEYAREDERILGLETAQGLPSDIMEWSFLRGASKQFGALTWNCISVWNRWGYLDFEGTGPDHGTDHGTTPELMKRLMYVTYMYGSACNMYEGSYFTAEKDAQGLPKLSPVGQDYVDAVKWARDHADRGVLYTPVGVMLDRDSGWVPPRHLYTGSFNLVWGNLPYSRGDYATDAFFRRVWPLYQDGSYYKDERGFLTATPYGDMFDVIESDATAECLKRYQTVVVMGEVTMDDAVVRRLREFVDGGGEVICDAVAATALGEKMSGLSFPGERKAAQMSVLTGDGRVLEEEPYSYAIAKPSGAEAVALSEHGDGILWTHAYGKGKVITCAASCFVAAETEDKQPGVDVPLKHKLLRAFAEGLAPYLQSLSPVTVESEGAPVQWLVNVGADKRRYVVTLSNNEHVGAKVTVRLKGGPIGQAKAWLGQADLRDGAVTVTLAERGVAIVEIRGG